MELTEKQKMLAGALYRADSPELVADQKAAAAWAKRYNALSDQDASVRQAVLRELMGSVGDNVNIRPPFYCDYGYNIHLGAGVFMNFNCVILDVAPVTIGDLTQIGPGVQILTADHPRDPEQRRAGLESGRPIVIGQNVWIGAGALILPGVTIGDDVIIGAGSIVTRDVKSGETVKGNPARPASGS
jgi:maltose O-acetyltransferase